MSSAAFSTSPTPDPGPAVLSGPVAVCVDRPLLSLDRPFTYDLPEELDAGIGSLVQVRFHGKLVRGWVLGPTGDVPARMLKVHKRVSPIRFFDERMVDLYRWIGERYVAPLASVIGRSYPPRVASEEVSGTSGGVVAAGGGSPRRSALTGSVEMASSGFAPRPTALRDGAAASGGTSDAGRLLSDEYVNGPRLLDDLRDGSGTYVVRTGPGEEADVAVECVAAALAHGRGVIVVVPEVDPMPATVRAIVDAFGEEVVCFFGEDKRSRYRTWLQIANGRYGVVVGTRPAVFAPVSNLGLLFVGREHHALHREERSPYFHVRDVAVARAARQGAVTVLASVMPSLEGLEVPHVDVEPVGRRWPRVEAVKPGPEGRAPRLLAALRQARRAFLYEPIRGYGVARVCRACGEPAACASCGGMLRSEDGSIRCTVCEAVGRCAACGAGDFGVARGGAERVVQWARGVAAVPVSRIGPSDRPRPPGDAEVVVGGIDGVKDFGPLQLDLVGILNADASLRRAGIAARERALTAWAEVAAWAGPSGRVVLQTNRPNDHAVQALVAGKPDRFARTEKQRLADAGFPVGAPVFRVVGTASLAEEMATLTHRTLLVSALEEQTVCLVALDPGDVVAFGAAIRRLAERGVVTRVEAEPHL
jgi:primosomal protein N' (replication factor Y) (superfamily II helicase)